MTEDYLMELKNSGVIIGGGEEEDHYRVELPRWGERVCELNLEHPRVPHWLWVNEVMFTEFGVRIPFSPFQRRLLQRCFVAPSQFHPNAWSAIRCFELVTEFLELPQDPQDLRMPMEKPRKVFAVGDHPPFWLTLERDAGRFPSYWSKDVEVNYVPTAYRKLNEEQRDTANILLWLFSERVLKPKAVLGNPERARATIVEMAGKNKTLANLRRAMVANPQCPIILSSSAGQASSSSPEGGSSSNVEGDTGNRPEVSSPVREEVPEKNVEIPPPPSPLGKRVLPRISEGSQRDFCPMDRSFDASGYIESNFLGPRAVEALRDYDPMESLRCAEWAMLRSQKADVEKEEAEAAKSKAEKDLEVALADAKEKGVELQRLRDREAGLLVDFEAAKKELSRVKSRADRAEASLVSMEQARQELVKLAEDFVKAIEDALKEQILVLAPDFVVSLLGARKEVVDGQIVDPPLEP
ncbi:hypothetical protein PIB30_024694 [Stylosanthes scabra]|uniref:Uncharacterized protein n=1 Tax=Stylosanthes scabra TaxID=79078 RepID=A0ABU6QB88_9FABA|nr:hypothetical protein [Stylosanthes scabra]